MNVFNQFLDDRGQPAGRQADDELLVWLNQGNAPEVRLLKFDAWVGRQLATRLDWTWAGAAKPKRIEQCRIYLERLVLEMWRRGWMLDGKRLAAHIETVLDSVGAYQRAGKVVEFWPYFRACVDRYVGANAEEIRAEAMRAGAHMGDLLSALGINRGPIRPTVPELVAQRAAEIANGKGTTLRRKLQLRRANDAASNVESAQLKLL